MLALSLPFAYQLERRNVQWDVRTCFVMASLHNSPPSLDLSSTNWYLACARFSTIYQREEKSIWGRSSNFHFLNFQIVVRSLQEIFVWVEYNMSEGISIRERPRAPHTFCTVKSVLGCEVCEMRETDQWQSCGGGQRLKVYLFNPLDHVETPRTSSY